MMKIDTIIFDLDGTLLNTIEDINDSVNYALKKHKLDEVGLEKMKSYLGYGGKYLIDHSSNFDNNSDKILKTYIKRYNRKFSIKTKPYRDIEELLETLFINGYKIGVISNKSNDLVSKIIQKHLKKYITFYLGETDNLSPKPDKGMLDYTLFKMNSKASKTLYVGDSEVDIRFAKNANVDSVAVTWGFREKEVLIKGKPNFIIEEPFDLLEILKIYNGGI